MEIILPRVPYRIARESVSILILSDRRELLCLKLFDAMKNQKHKLHDLLPLKRAAIYSLRQKEITLYQNATQIVTKIVFPYEVYFSCQ